MIASRYFIIATLALVVTTASAAEGISVKALLMQALDAPDGKAKGIVAGKEADAIHAATGASDPVRAEVSTIKKFKQEGCSRLAVRLVQPNAPTKADSSFLISLALISLTPIPASATPSPPQAAAATCPLTSCPRGFAARR